MQARSIIAIGLIASATGAPTHAAIDVEPPRYSPLSEIEQSSYMDAFAVVEYGLAKERLEDQQGEIFTSNYVQLDAIEAYSQSRAELFWRTQENSKEAWDFYVGTELDVYARHTKPYGINSGTMGTAHVGHSTEFTLDRPTEYTLSGYANWVILNKMVSETEDVSFYQRLHAFISPDEPTEVSGVLAPGKYQMKYASSTSTSISYHPQISQGEHHSYATNKVDHFASLRLSAASNFGGYEPVPEIDAKSGTIALGLLAVIWALFCERRRGEPSARRRLRQTHPALFFQKEACL